MNDRLGFDSPIIEKTVAAMMAVEAMIAGELKQVTALAAMMPPEVKTTQQ